MALPAPRAAPGAAKTTLRLFSAGLTGALVAAGAVRAAGRDAGQLCSKQPAPAPRTLAGGQPRVALLLVLLLHVVPLLVEEALRALLLQVERLQRDAAVRGRLQPLLHRLQVGVAHQLGVCGRGLRALSQGLRMLGRRRLLE